MTELAQELKDALGAVEHVQKTMDAYGEKAKDFDAVKEATSKAADAIEAMQEENQKAAGERAALENTIEELKKKVARGGMSKSDQEEIDRYNGQLSRYLRKGVAPDSELVEDVAREIVEKHFKGAEADEIALEVKDLVTGSNPDGGYMVPVERSNRMIRRIFETSPMRGLATVVTMSSGSLEMIIDDDEAASGGWVGEVDPRPNTDTPQIGKLVIEAHEQYANPRVTQTMLDDGAFDVEGWLQNKVTAKMSRVENNAFVVGDGAAKPKGILAYADADTYGTYQRGRIQTLTSETVGAITGDDIKLLQNGIKEEYQGNSSWIMNRLTFGDIITLKDSSDQYIFRSRFIDDSEVMRLQGRPITFFNDMPVVAGDALAVAYGDFSEGYTIADRVGFRVLRDPYTAKPFIQLYTTKRTGGDVTSYDSWNRLRIQS